MESKTEYCFAAGPGNEFDFDYAVNDALIFNLYSYRILVFKIDDPSNYQASTDAIKVALQNLVRRCPPLGGTIVFTEDKPGMQHGWKKVYPGPGIKLVTHDLRVKLDYSALEARDFPTDLLASKDLVPISLAPIMEGDAPGSVFQYTLITGGALLTVGINHTVTDGNGMNTVMGMLAEECKRAQMKPVQENGSLVPTIVGTDRNHVRALDGKTKNRPEDHPSYTFLTELPSHDEDHGPESDIAAFMFAIDTKKQAELKSIANAINPRISTHDGISALIWRSVIVARCAMGVLTDLDADAEFHVPTDCRRFVGLENNYIGNMVYYVTCTMPIRELLAPDSLPKAAALIRAALESRNKELIAGYHNLCKSLANLNQMTFGWIPRLETTAVSIGSSWRANQMYGADWGDAFGPVKRFRSPDVGFFGIFKGLPFICPPLPDTGLAEFQVWLNEKGWQALQKDGLFTRFCTRIGE